MKVNAKARYMRKRRKNITAEEMSLFAKYPGVPGVDANVSEKRRKLRQRDPDKLLLQRPAWVDDVECDVEGISMKTCWPYNLALRTGTTDESAFREVFEKGVYARSLKRGGSHWIDVGAHAGYFAAAALMQGCKSIACYEPFLPNYNLARYNLLGFGCKLHQMAVVAHAASDQATVALYVPTNPGNNWRHSILPVRGRVVIRVRAISMAQVLKNNRKADSVKLDCEGAELDILEALQWPSRINVLVFEYSFSHDASVPRFKAIIATLRKQGFQCEFPPSTLRRPAGKKIHNRDRLVHCCRK